MDETSQATVADETVLTFWDRHRLSLLLLLTVIVTIVLTIVSIIIYTASGTVQLDLSRPSYKQVSDQVDRDTTIDEFGATGSVDASTVNDYLVLYDEQAKKVKAVDAFNGDPLNPDLLQLATPSGE